MQDIHKYCIFIVSSRRLKSRQICEICVYWNKHYEMNYNINDMKDAELAEHIEY